MNNKGTAALEILRGRALTLIAVVMLAGCTTVPAQREWGSEVTLRPGWMRVQTAAKAAVTDPWTWVPLASAAVLQIDNWDHRASRWARSHQPVFGSTGNAEDWSDNLRATSLVLQTATLLATPSGDEPGEWLLNKAKGGAIEYAAIGLTFAATSTLKKATDRERPNERDHKSLPSGHSSTAAVAGRLTRFNLEAIEVSSTVRRVAGFGVAAMTLGTGWARVESGWHYPSDALAGIALGNFIASFMTQSFFSGNAADTFALESTGDGAVLRWQVAF